MRVIELPSCNRKSRAVSSWKRALRVMQLAEHFFQFTGAGFGLCSSRLFPVSASPFYEDLCFGPGASHPFPVSASPFSDKSGHVSPGCRDVQSQLPLFPPQVQVQRGAVALQYILCQIIYRMGFVCVVHQTVAG